MTLSKLILKKANATEDTERQRQAHTQRMARQILRLFTPVNLGKAQGLPSYDISHMDTYVLLQRDI